MSHKEGCKWEKTHFSMYSFDPDDDGEEIRIDNCGIYYQPPNCPSIDEIVYIDFKFCPLCGCSLNEENEDG